MKKPRQPNQFDPDALDFYIWDHLNVHERLKRLELSFSSRATRANYPNQVYRRDLPLARGYSHARAKRPANFCRIIVQVPPFGHSLSVNFGFGWLRRTSSVYKIKHILVSAPHGHFGTEFSTDQHELLAGFESEMAALINTLHTHSFKDITELFEFMGAWRNNRHADDRIREAYKHIKPEPEPTVKILDQSAKPHKYRMGRMNVRHFSGQRGR